VIDDFVLGCLVADTQRELLKRACNFWLEGELARDVRAPADFYERMRDIYLLVNTKKPPPCPRRYLLLSELLWLSCPLSYLPSWGKLRLVKVCPCNLNNRPS
jgi:hypothetical protein